MLKNNGQTTYAPKGGNAQSGGLSTSDDSLSTLGRCLDIDGDGTVPAQQFPLS